MKVEELGFQCMIEQTEDESEGKETQDVQDNVISITIDIKIHCFTVKAYSHLL